MDYVGDLIDVYKDGFREALNDCETEFRPLTDEERFRAFRLAQLDVNMLRRLVALGQKCIDQMQDGTLPLQKARELSGEMVPWDDDDEEEDQTNEDDSPAT
jgi:hypothetical protein